MAMASTSTLTFAMKAFASALLRPGLVLDSVGAAAGALAGKLAAAGAVAVAAMARAVATLAAIARALSALAAVEPPTGAFADCSGAELSGGPEL